jgi:hypothetical protein
MSLGVNAAWRKNECSFIILAKNKCVPRDCFIYSMLESMVNTSLPKINIMLLFYVSTI